MTVLMALLLAASPVAASLPATGSYHSGDGLGFIWSLILTADGRFSFDWQGCFGTYDENRGTAKLDGAWLVLAPELPRDNGFARQLPLRWLYLVWGDRHYLIADDELAEFVRAVNEGSEPRSGVHGSFLLREPDWSLPASELPELPPEWSKLFRPEPISTMVVAVDEDGVATLDRGTSGGVEVGLPLAVWPDGSEAEPRFAWGTVIEAGSTSARFRVDMGDEVRVGDTATTRHP